MPCYGIYRQQPLTEGEIRATDVTLLLLALQEVGLRSHNYAGVAARIVREQRIVIAGNVDQAQAKLVALRATYSRLAIEQAARKAGFRATTTTQGQRQVTHVTSR